MANSQSFSTTDMDLYVVVLGGNYGMNYNLKQMLN